MIQVRFHPKRLLCFFLCLVVLTLFPLLVSAHETMVTPLRNATEMSLADPLVYIILTSLLLAFATVILVLAGSHFSDTYKKIFFIVLLIPIALSSLYLAGNTIYENITSATHGPVHWHADYEVFVCGERLNLVDPHFPKNKIGSPLIHEHDDDRIHLEGTLMHLEEASVSKYFSTIGGELEKSHLRYPTSEVYYDLEDGDPCPDGSKGTLKVYVNGKIKDDFASYIIYPDSLVPPGDCIIVLFDSSNRETTDILCESWTARNWDYQNFQRRPVTLGGTTWQ